MIHQKHLYLWPHDGRCCAHRLPSTCIFGAGERGACAGLMKLGLQGPQCLQSSHLAVAPLHCATHVTSGKSLLQPVCPFHDGSDLGTQPTPTPPWRVLADPCWPSASHRVLCLHARLSASCLELLRRQFPWQPQDGSSQAAWEGDAAPTLAFVPTGSGWRGWTGGASLWVWSRGLNIGGGAWQDGEQGRGSRRARGWEVGPAWVVYSYGSGFGVAGGG